MDSKAITLLKKDRICVLSVVQEDGSPHSAAVHYSEQSDPVKLFIQTFPSTKTKAIEAKGGVAPAAVVVGFDEEELVTLQMRGEIRIVTEDAEKEKVFAIHYAKHPQAEKHKSPATILLEFTPAWWRYTDLKATPRIVIASND